MKFEFNAKLRSFEKFNQKTKIDSFGIKKGGRKPKSWSIIHYKEYPRFPVIELPKIQTKISKNIFDIIKNRRSEREFIKGFINLRELSCLLLYSCGILKKSSDPDKNRRTYPSAGARYPLEVYLVNFDIQNLKKGIYHYNVKKHTLEQILLGNFRKKIVEFTDQDWIKKSICIILISAIFKRTTIKYGDRGYRYVLFEAGHLMQNINLIADALGIKSCNIGGFLDNKINELLDIDGIRESVIYICGLGKK